jgi:hypothetical protein
VLTLRAEGVLFLYGPYRRSRSTHRSDVFDASLRACNPEWGACAMWKLWLTLLRAMGLLEQVVEMPANNLSLAFRRSSLSNGEGNRQQIRGRRLVEGAGP